LQYIFILFKKDASQGMDVQNFHQESGHTFSPRMKRGARNGLKQYPGATGAHQPKLLSAVFILKRLISELKEKTQTHDES
jgi:hypothetical protein